MERRQQGKPHVGKQQLSRVLLGSRQLLIVVLPLHLNEKGISHSPQLVVLPQNQGELPFQLSPLRLEALP